MMLMETVQGNTFVDNQGAEWILTITFGTISRAKKELKFDLDKLIGEPDQLANIIYKDPIKFGSLLWIICEKQAVARNLKPDDFIDRLGGGRSHDAMISAFLNAIVDFCPRSKVAEAIKAKWLELQDKMDNALIKMVNEASNLALSKMDTKLQALSASIQQSTVTEN